MKNLILIIAITSLFSCKKEDKVTVDPNAPKTGKFEYTFTATPENKDRPTIVSLNFYTIKGGKNVNTSKTFVLTFNNNVAKWDTTISANNVTGNVTSRYLLRDANFTATFNGVTIYNQPVYPNSSGTSLLTKDL